MKANLPLSQALGIAKRFQKVIEPYCQKVTVAGSVRRMKPNVGDIELVCVPLESDSLDKFFASGYPGMHINGHRLKRFKYPKSAVQIELYITTPTDYGRILAIRTGSSAYSHLQLAVQWNRLGWCGTPDGLRRKKECDHKKGGWKIKPEYKDNPTMPPPFLTEEDFFKFLKIPWLSPDKRNWTSRDKTKNYAI